MVSLCYVARFHITDTLQMTYLRSETISEKASSKLNLRSTNGSPHSGKRLMEKRRKISPVSLRDLHKPMGVDNHTDGEVKKFEGVLTCRDTMPIRS